MIIINIIIINKITINNINQKNLLKNLHLTTNLKCL